MLKGNSKPTAEYNLEAMQHRQQGNRSRNNQGQQRDPHPHGGQRQKPTTCTGDKNMCSGEKCGQCGGDRHSWA